MRRRSFLASALGMMACGSDPAPTISAPPSAARSSLRLLSYNVLADPVHLDQRLPALFREMRDARADVIALQEVAPWFLEAVGRERWADAFSFCEVAGRGADRGGQAFLSKVEVRNPYSIDLGGRQQRTALLVDVDVGGDEPIALATTHMESFLEDGPTRAAQLDAIFRALNRSSSSSRVLCGDLNFGEGEEPDTAHLDSTYTDLWNALHPGEAGYTWDIERSEMARVSSFVGEGSRRLDRVLLKSETWRGESIEVVGDSPVTPDRRLFPSDHFGIACELRRV
ncbi:MAG: endonuclease/exonuclease/phosphatase family metal-dependent hydrolase [Polyangiales bacterium]|jgi:endonuclease/exonuclease/phosphatase family metal-dependent hydrolase